MTINEKGNTGPYLGLGLNCDSTTESHHCKDKTQHLQKPPVSVNAYYSCSCYNISMLEVQCKKIVWACAAKVSKNMPKMYGNLFHRIPSNVEWLAALEIPPKPMMEKMYKQLFCQHSLYINMDRVSIIKQNHTQRTEAMHILIKTSFKNQYVEGKSDTFNPFFGHAALF